MRLLRERPSHCSGIFVSDCLTRALDGENDPLQLDELFRARHSEDEKESDLAGLGK